ncbi:uncharacterized protein LOC114877903 [Osmia bicornis bicornis]|uniref:uncharacterized protein LOC114877903 n=1 Tax=Osmia bicornis bicornis TaxID=1437191 RepID=UPI001EAF0136|nr:uncharacterized protein LOC114877903 [Osmia bicornis bicornis]
MKKVGRKSIDYYILPNKILCSVLGSSLAEEKYTTSGKIFAYSRLIVAIAAAGSIFVPQIMLVAVNWGDLRILTGVGCVITTFGQYIFKLIYVVARRERVERLYKELRSLWNSTDDPEEMKSYEEYAYWGRICTITFYTLGLWTTIMFTITAAIDNFTIEYTDNNSDKTRYLPFEVWYGRNVTESPKFEVAFICQFVAALMSCTGIWAIDTSCMTTLLHVSGQFKLINTWISSIGIESDCEPTDHCRNYLPNVEANLIKCIRHHQRMIKYSIQQPPILLCCDKCKKRECECNDYSNL